ncbi:MAG TPA: hypothetical protein DHW82_03745 [Spirochaetia bacterium]|nr:MAG: hypothetical protein A2Y41_04170 [Spirochaetes bacterium GWB1_36_13]HCL56106.1 hypothetical protein [Spirochaetia bacterium]
MEKIIFKAMGIENLFDYFNDSDESIEHIFNKVSEKIKKSKWLSYEMDEFEGTYMVGVAIDKIGQFCENEKELKSKIAKEINETCKPEKLILPENISMIDYEEDEDFDIAFKAAGIPDLFAYFDESDQSMEYIFTEVTDWIEECDCLDFEANTSAGSYMVGYPMDKITSLPDDLEEAKKIIAKTINSICKPQKQIKPSDIVLLEFENGHLKVSPFKK